MRSREPVRSARPAVGRPHGIAVLRRAELHVEARSARRAEILLIFGIRFARVALFHTVFKPQKPLIFGPVDPLPLQQAHLQSARKLGLKSLHHLCTASVTPADPSTPKNPFLMPKSPKTSPMLQYYYTDKTAP